jgi:hypothetical protein
MKVKYTPGTSDGLVGKTFKVEIVGMHMKKTPLVLFPVLSSVKIRYESGKTEWVNATDFYKNIESTKNIVRHTY